MNLRTMLLVLILSSSFFRVQAGSMNLHGSLIIISCTINNERPLDVTFDEAIGVTLVDGEKYRKDMELGIECSSSPGNLLQMKLLGEPTIFDQGAIITDVKDLGIKLLINEEPIILNETLPLNNDRILNLSAVPVKRPNSQLSSGTFHGHVILQIVLE